LVAWDFNDIEDEGSVQGLTCPYVTAMNRELLLMNDQNSVNHPSMGCWGVVGQKYVMHLIR
jgi:hypothetical protein